ncbi:NAD-binding protein [Bordetella ansorpii]|uniref:NAD-binding protein n=1 Tax=Bordetella ansorpii TaxID=288768 RepID=A0A157P6K8_9BORD|nr:D-2-hydroxyacid dehydrogenase [Bordetella ansorpii]SAI29215.1 NAD-binding protein [Bordetella ansorpii]
MTDTRTRGPALGLLLSDSVDQQHGPRLDALAQSAGVRLQRHPLSRAAQALPDLHAAFFSRELYAGSSLRKPGPLSNAFFQVADAAPNLRWLHVFSSGRDLPQYAASLARGVRVTSSTGVSAKPIAQTAVAAILAQSRGFDHWLAAQARREWSPLSGDARPRELESLRVLLVGTGAIGGEIARLLTALGLHVTGVRRRPEPDPAYAAVLPLDQLDQALPQCDWLVLALPLTPDSAGMIDARRLALLPAHARIANIARGELIDEPALADALANGRLAGAYLDTFVEEPLPQASPLWGMPQVWVSPHNSAASRGHEERVVDAFVRELETELRMCTTAG